jgi:hypothetical protein
MKLEPLRGPLINWSFFLIVYIIYFYITSGGGVPTLVTTVASGQSQAWFVPFVWLGLALTNIAGGLLLQGVAFFALSISSALPQTPLPGISSGYLSTSSGLNMNVNPGLRSRRSG